MSYETSDLEELLEQRGHALQDVQRIVAQTSALLTLSTSDKVSIATSTQPPTLDEFVSQVISILNQHRSALPEALSVITDFVPTPLATGNGRDDNTDTDNQLAKSVFQGLDSEIIDMLSKVDLEGARNDIISALHGDDLATFAGLALKHPMLVTEMDGLGGTLLHVVLELQNQTKKSQAGSNLLPFIRVLLQNGADPNVLSSEGTAPIHLAATTGQVSILREMIRYGGKIELKDRVGRTPLYISTLQGKLECVRACLDAGGDPMIPNKSGCTCVHAAVLRDRLNELRCLLEYVQANWNSKQVYQLLNAQDRDGRTAAHMAASCNLTSVVEELCRCQGLLDLSIRDRWQQTPWDTATPETRLLLNSMEAKRVVVHIATSADSPASPHHDQDPNHVEKLFAVGVIEVQNELTWKDFDLLVGQILEKHCYDLASSYNMLKERDITALRYVKPSEAAIANSINIKTKKGRLQLNRRNSAPNIRDAQLEQQQQLNIPILTEKYWDLSFSAESKKRQAAAQEILAHYFTSEVQLGLDQSSIGSYTLGRYSWSPDKYPQISVTKTVYQILENELRNLYVEGTSLDSKSQSHSLTLNMVVRLKGSEEGKLDQLAYESLTPITKLESYIDLVLDIKNVIISGALGCGKTLLAEYMAECLKQQFMYNGKNAQVYTVCLHPSFKREDLLELLIETGCILQMTSDSTAQAISRNKSVQDITPIIVLDNLDQVNITEVIGELLTSLEFRGLACPQWNSGFTNSSQVKFPPGEYFLRTDSYFIATLSRSGWSGLSQIVRDSFSHIQCSVFDEPVSGLLNRFLMRSVISQNGGVVVKNNDLFSSLQWISEVWYLYNCYLQKYQLAELQIGPRHFFSCPTESEDWAAIYRWLATLWNHKIAPFIEDQLLLKTAMYSSPNVPSSDMVIGSLIQNALVSTCPLAIGHFHEFYSSLKTVKPQTLAPIDPAELGSTVSLFTQTSSSSQSGVTYNRPGGGRFSLLEQSYQYRSNTLPKKLHPKPQGTTSPDQAQILRLQQIRSQSVSLHDRSKKKEEKKPKKSGLFRRKPSKDNRPDLISVPQMMNPEIEDPETSLPTSTIRPQSYDKEIRIRSHSTEELSPSKYHHAGPSQVMQSEI
ncbi:Cortactin-binding protein 2-like [Oopsacas minuta]|uniref:Cortactin-binding protein 2-like n=1 Tax=Oopsacas minuta TaxID=111878 RepID=A0AAV7JYU6_9METZ|nr:Cortactin-binding protein 2-like [Oopsacas minuta]